MEDKGESTVPVPVADEAPAVVPDAPTTTSPDPASNPPAEQSQPQPMEEDNESDWEDLDEVLDDFSAQQQQQPPQEQQEPTNQSQSQDGGKSEAAPEPDINEEEMLKQLEASMAEFVKASTSAAPGEGVPVDETWSAVADAVGMPPADLMKLLMGEDGAGAAGGEQKQSAAAGGSSSAAPPAGGEDFQETIRKTMERIHESGEKATAAASEGAGDDLLMQVLKAMEGAGGGDGDGDGEDLDKLFLGIMEQLSNKEMLYEPMKELHDKFGPWLKENRDKTPKEDLEKYELQATLVAEIVGRFEEKDFNDENPEHRDYIWQRMQKMQAAGSPPDDLVSNPFGDDGKLQESLAADGGCPQQ